MKETLTNPARAAMTMAAVGLACILLAAPVAAQQEQSGREADEEYSRILRESPEHVKHIESVDSLLAADEELEESYLAYQDSLTANPELAAREGDFFKAVEEDTVLAQMLAEFEEDAATEPEAVGELAFMDSVTAAEPELAARLMELESAAAEDPKLMDDYAEQMAYLGTRPMEAAEFFSDEDGPYYSDTDETMVAFVYYLESHPRLFRAYWELYHYLGTREALRTALQRHWRWYWPRRDLWKLQWRYRLWAARDPRVHRIVWDRCLYLGGRPWLGRAVWRHHFVVGARPLARPVLSKHRAFVATHPTHAATVAAHRKWTKVHNPRPAKPHAPGVKAGAQPRLKEAPKAKPKPKKGAP